MCSFSDSNGVISDLNTQTKEKGRLSEFTKFNQAVATSHGYSYQKTFKCEGVWPTMKLNLSLVGSLDSRAFSTYWKAMCHERP